MPQDLFVIFLMGPTASGKTKLAIELCQHLPFDIISVDSTMIYKRMDIGTAKPSKAELAIAPHGLIDICEPHESYSAAQFCSDALKLIKVSLAKQRIPLLVGGTMLYFHALKHGLSPLPKADPTIRATLSKEAKDSSWQILHERLAKIDPDSARRIHPNDPQRIQRALEVHLITGKTLSELWNETSPTFPFRSIEIALMPEDRTQLNRLIEKRFYALLDQGFLHEAKQFYKQKNLHAELPSMRSVGYRQAWQYFSGELSKEEMISASITATRQLAKRQLTWLRRWTDATWFNSQSPDVVKKIFMFLKKVS